jgi:hypothetical protein
MSPFRERVPEDIRRPAYCQPLAAARPNPREKQYNIKQPKGMRTVSIGNSRRAAGFPHGTTAAPGFSRRTFTAPPPVPA